MSRMCKITQFGIPRCACCGSTSKVKINESTVLLYLDFLLRFGRVLYLYPYFEPRTGCWVWSLLPSEPLTGLGSHPFRFRFKSEFRTRLQQHYAHCSFSLLLPKHIWWMMLNIHHCQGRYYSPWTSDSHLWSPAQENTHQTQRSRSHLYVHFGCYKDEDEGRAMVSLSHIHHQTLPPHLHNGAHSVKYTDIVHVW